MKYLIAAGGTGGHIIPGIAIANMLKSEGHEVMFIGTQYGMEKDLVGKAGYDIRFIHASGLNAGILAKIKALINLRKGTKEAKKIIIDEKIDRVVGTGGYVTAPVIKAAQSLNLPNYIHESNALPGKATRLFSKKTTCTMVGFEDAKNRLKGNIICTGNPSKMGENSYTKSDAKKIINITGKLLLITGGSQGAKRINEVIIDVLKNKMFGDYNVIYATGPKNFNFVKTEVLKFAEDFYNVDVREDEIELSPISDSLTLSEKSDQSVNIKTINNNDNKIIIKKFIYNMEEVMKAADVMLSRSGALTCTEIIECETPAILVPFPYAAENHQYYNAKTIEDIGSGIIIEEDKLNKETLIRDIESIINDDEKIIQMSKNFKSLQKSNAILNIKNVICK